MSHLYDIMELSKLKAINSKLSPNDESVWRSVLRDYSITFSTPLHLVSQLPPGEILLAIYENQLETLNLDEEKDLQVVLDSLYTIEDPSYDRNREADELAYNKKAEQEEEERIAKKAAKKAAKENTSEKKEPALELPKAGGINLAYLADNADGEG